MGPVVGHGIAQETPFAPFEAGLTEVDQTSSDIGDVDGDGNADLIVTGENRSSDATAKLHLGDGQGGFTEAGADLTGVITGSSSFGDVDGDGNLDLLITGDDQDSFFSEQDLEATLYLGDGQGGFTEAGAGLTGVESSSSSFGDVDNDGALDLVITGEDIDDNLMTTVYLSDGEGGFTEAEAGLAGVENGSSAFGDVDNDGNLDLLITGSEQGISGAPVTKLYLGDGEGGFTEKDAGLPDVGGGTGTFGDVDDDGNLDIFLAGSGESSQVITTLFLGDGEGGFTETDFTPIPSGVTAASSAFGDVNADGNLDLMVAGNASVDDPEVTLYRGDGQGSFTAVTGTGVNGVIGEPLLFGDVDNDGHLDLVHDNTVYENLNEGDLLVSSVSETVSTDGAIDFGGTGVSISFSGTSGSGDVTVKKFSDGPRSPEGIAESRVSNYRFRISAGGDLAFGDETELRLDVATLAGVSDPSNVTIYRRQIEGQGQFTSLSTSVDTDASELVATTGSFSEFVLASNSEPLPVELARFEATADGSGRTVLSWRTASETANSGFDVQRRVGEPGQAEGSSWTTVGFVEGAGTTSEPQSYRFTDSDLPYDAGRLTYRLRQVDTDGTTTLSDPVVIERSVSEAQLLGTFPNPASQQATVRYALPAQQDVQIRLYDALGRQVRTMVNGQKEGRQEETIDVSGLPSGTYFLRLQAGNAERSQQVTVVR